METTCNIITNIIRTLRVHVLTVLTLCLACSAYGQNKPAITSFTPASGPTTTVVTINGTNFNRDINGAVWSGTPPWRVQFGGSGLAIPTFISNTQIQATVPSNGTNGQITLRQGAGNQVVCSSPASFTLTQVTRPAISSFTPASGPVGTQITITGTNFNRSSVGTVFAGAPPYRVAFGVPGGFIEAAPTFISNTQIRVTVPAGAEAGTLPGILRMRQSGVEFTSSTTTFTVAAPPKPAIASFTPSSGAVGTLVTFTGTNFNRDINANLWTGAVPYRVGFTGPNNSVIDVIPTFVSATQIRAVVPAGTVTGLVRIRQNGTVISTSSGSFTITQTLLQLINHTQYDIVSLKLSGQQLFTPGIGVPAGGTVNMVVAPGTYNLIAELGFVNGDGSLDILFNFTRTVTITSGQISAQSFARISVGQLLTMGANSSTWDGSYFDNNGGFHLARLVFTSTGGWQFFDDGVLRASGTVTEVSWPNSSTNITFRISNTLPNITISRPFGSFFFRNGPAGFPIIQYVRQ